MAHGKIASYFLSNDKGRKSNKSTASSSRVYAKHSELGKKKTAEIDFHSENRKKEYAGTENQRVSHSGLRENPRSLNSTYDSEGNYPEIKTLGKESQEFYLKLEKSILQEQVTKKDKQILDLEAKIVELQMKHREEVRSLEEEKRSVIRELCKPIAHYKDKLKFKTQHSKRLVF